MNSYPIHELERLTGIRAHTIRIWEKRYGLIAPDRTATNRRYYSDKQMKKLLNVSTLLAHGQKISKIAALSEDELHNEIINDTINAKQSIHTGHINDLVTAMLAFDEAAFEETFAAAVALIGLYDAMLHIIYPFLNKVGMTWRIERTAPVQEHFATGIICRKIMAATDALKKPATSSEKFLLFLPEQEWHEIGLQFANYILRAKGYKTIYLGQNVPLENIQKITPAVKPEYMLLFYIAARPKEEVAMQIKAFAEIDKNIKVLIAGNAELFSTKTKIKNVTYLNDVNGLLNLL